MSSKRRYRYMDDFRPLTTMAQEIVAQDPDYKYYVGADYNTAIDIAILISLIKLHDKGFIILTDKLYNYIQIMLVIFEQERKAFFSTLGCGELTKLGLIKGDTRITVTGKHLSEKTK